MSDADPQRKRYPVDPPPHKRVLFDLSLWRGYHPWPFVHVPSVQSVEDGCDEIDVGAIQGWMRHSRRSTLHVCQGQILPAMRTRRRGRTSCGAKPAA